MNMIIGIAVCCREWPVLVGVGMGFCGYCKQQPVVVRIEPKCPAKS